MSKERPTAARQPTPGERFGFTRGEQLVDRVSHERLLGFLAEEGTRVHRVEESSNAYGEFLFVTLSRPDQTRRITVTFFGLGYHEHRERWLLDEWFWYVANPFPETLEQELSPDEARQRLEERRTDIQAHAWQATQSRRGALFEMLADLTDDDGALAEMDDLGDLADWLADALE